MRCPRSIWRTQPASSLCYNSALLKEDDISAVRDPIPVPISWYRKMITIRAVSAAHFTEPLGQEDYLQKMKQIQGEAVRAPMPVKTAAFWKMENLSSAFLKNARPGQSLNDPRMTVEVRPISHCGMGIAAVELTEFDAARLTDTLESFSNPEYRLFAYEGAGAMMALYQPDLFGAMAKGFGALGVLPMAPIKCPDNAKFIRSFDPEIRRLIAHGYGRMLYFKSHNIATAIRAARRATACQFEPCVQGVAFAYSMVNNSDLHRVFGAGRELRDRELRPAFIAGLVYAIEFWEWMAPGFIDGFAEADAFEASLFSAARQSVTASRARGPLLPFAVEPEIACGLCAAI